jgi:SDR family mycofactocin-dependent oxidoreductase
LAEEGADIIAVDVLEDYATVPYPLATQCDLDETVARVEALGRRIVARKADVRDLAGLKAVVDEGVGELGRLDIVSANAGIANPPLGWDEVTPELWRDTLDTNLTGVWHTIVAATPHLIASGGGSIICTGSTGGVKGLPFVTAYVAAKHGVVGIVRSMANELGKYLIRVNAVHPAGVATPLADGLGVDGLVNRDPNLTAIFMNSLPIEMADPRDISNAVLFLASDEARCITGLSLTIDMGNTNR